MTELFALFQRAASGFGTHVHAIGEGQWHDPTPCTDWDVRTLVNHVTVEQLWVPPLVGGSTVADIGDRLDGDQLGSDPVAAWDAALKDSNAAFGAPGALDGTVLLSRGEIPTAEYCWEMTTDALDPFVGSRAWHRRRRDARRRVGRAGVRADTSDRRASSRRRALFAPPVPIPDDAPMPTKLLALFGRRA